MKHADEIVEWGTVKPYFDKQYRFNSIDIETIDNELFLFGYVNRGVYNYTLNNFYETFNDFLISSLQNNRDILTWSRYDNTHLFKLLLKDVKKSDIKDILLLVGKVSPIYQYDYKTFTIKIENIIKDSMIFSIKSIYGDKWKRIVIYNLKNLYHTNLEKTAENYNIDYYSKLDISYHIIDKDRFFNDSKYKSGVLKSNELDNRVLIDIAKIMLNDFKTITGVYPKSIFTAGSIARSYILAYSTNPDNNYNFKLQFKSKFRKSKKRDKLLDYAMRAYHGGKIESYVIGYVKKAKYIDISSAYPYAMSKLPLMTGKYKYYDNDDGLNQYFYAFINCDVYIKDKNFIHPLIVPNPINKSNISPYGYIKDIIITKIEYDYLMKNNIEIKVHNYIGVESDNTIFPYKDIVNDLFYSRMKYKNSNKSLAELFKTIVNSLYGITYELTDKYILSKDGVKWLGYRAGDYFEPLIASYITAFTRTYLSDVSYNVVQNGGKVLLNMTDSIIYDGDVTLDVFTDKKTLGTFEPPETIKDVIILGAGRYEYKNEFHNTYIIKSRGFSVNVKDKAFYNNIDLTKDIKLDHKTFVTVFKSTQKYGFEKMGHLIDDSYKFNPFNLGGKRVILNRDINLNKEYTDTEPIYLDKKLHI